MYERHERGLVSSIQALNGTNMGMEMSDITRKSLLNNKVEVITYSINDKNVKKCPHTYIHD
jgi:hypothetical protein